MRLDCFYLLGGSPLRGLGGWRSRRSWATRAPGALLHPGALMGQPGEHAHGSLRGAHGTPQCTHRMPCGAHGARAYEQAGARRGRCVGARALQLCNGRLGIVCFLMKNDAECYALCSHRPGCSVPLKGCFSKVPQLSTERGAAQSSV